MEEQNAKTIEVKSHRREVCKPVMRMNLPVEETHIYPEGINLDEYIEIGVETTDRIAIRPLAIGRKNYLYCGNHDAAVRAAIIYSLFSSCKAHNIDVRIWLEDALERIPTEKDINLLLTCNWQPLAANSEKLLLLL